jgi:hypothetical protein
MREGGSLHYLAKNTTRQLNSTLLKRDRVDSLEKLMIVPTFHAGVDDGLRAPSEGLPTFRRRYPRSRPYRSIPEHSIVASLNLILGVLGTWNVTRSAWNVWRYGMRWGTCAEHVLILNIIFDH